MDEALINIIHFDSDKLKIRLGHRDELYKQFIMLLQATLNGQLTTMTSELSECISTDNLVQLRSIAHKIKGISLSSSFDLLAHLSSTLEKETDTNKETLTKLLKDITDEVELLKTLVV